MSVKRRLERLERNLGAVNELVIEVYYQDDYGNLSEVSSLERIKEDVLISWPVVESQAFKPSSPHTIVNQQDQP